MAQLSKMRSANTNSVQSPSVQKLTVGKNTDLTARFAAGATYHINYNQPGKSQKQLNQFSFLSLATHFLYFQKQTISKLHLHAKK